MSNVTTIGIDIAKSVFQLCGLNQARKVVFRVRGTQYLIILLSAHGKTRPNYNSALPYHIIQRGNRRQDVFFKESDYLYYITLLKQWCELSIVSPEL